MEIHLVEIWLRRDPLRWIAGAMAGILSGGIAAGIAMLLSKLAGFEASFPIKLLGTLFIGASSTEIGNGKGFVTGGIIFQCLSAILGIFFAHFTGTNRLKALIPMGIVWGCFSWIFIWNLFMQSFKTIFAAQIPSGPVFIICMSFGIALVSVAFFDPLLRNKS